MTPLNDTVLVEIVGSQYGNVAIPDKKYDSRTSCTVLQVGNEELDFLIGHEAFWRMFKDDAQFKDGNKTFAFIDASDILGYRA